MILNGIKTGIGLEHHIQHVALSAVAQGLNMMHGKMVCARCGTHLSRRALIVPGSTGMGWCQPRGAKRVWGASPPAPSKE